MAPGHIEISLLPSRAMDCYCVMDHSVFFVVDYKDHKQLSGGFCVEASLSENPLL